MYYIYIMFVFANYDKQKMRNTYHDNRNDYKVVNNGIGMKNK